MAGTLTISTLSDGTNSTSTTNLTKAPCVAWVNFNGLAGASIRASYNVSSVTFVSTGNYTITFTNALSDANYCITGTTTGSYSTSWLILNTNITGSGATELAPTTTAFSVETVQPSTARLDSKYINLAVFR